MMATSIPFFMYDGRELDHGWMRHCPGFELMRRTAYNERLGEVYVRDALAVHPWRTQNAEQAVLFYVPIWEVRRRRVHRAHAWPPAVCLLFFSHCYAHKPAGSQLQCGPMQWHVALAAHGASRCGAAAVEDLRASQRPSHGL